MRKAEIARKTSETDICIALNLDGTGQYSIDTKCGFLNHMLELFSRHGSFDLDIKCTGDVHVDYHHTCEDIGLTLGRAFSEALGERAGINRYGSCILPMDEALILAAVDLSGRPCLGYALEFSTEKIGDFDTELVSEFFGSMCRTLLSAIHLRQLAGENSHHIAEGAYKALARALREAVNIDMGSMGRIPSTKGTIL